MNNILIQDVAEVYIKDANSSDAYFFGLTTKNDVAQTVKQDALRAGIGNGIVAMLQSDKEVNFSVTTLLQNDDIFAIQSGKKFTNGTYTVQKTEQAKLTSGKLTITGTAKGTSALVVDALGKQIAGTIATNQVTITGGVEGATYTVIYPSDVTGDILSLDSKAFPKNYYVEMHTIGYNVETNEVACDVYWIFNKALPDGGLQAAYEAAKGNGNDIKFTAQLNIGSNEYGKYIVVPRIVA
jgi:hypothetical protein